MTQITYRDIDGTDYVRDVPNGTTVMHGARDTDVPRMPAECGGAAACATCIVRIPEEWAGKLEEPQDLEMSMLDEEDLAGNLRLSCQITVTPDLEGLLVELASARR